MKFLQCCRADFLSNTDELNRLLGYGANRECCSTSRIAIQFRQNDAVDIQAVIDNLERLSGDEVNSIGITGFCLGGRVSFLVAGSCPEAISAAAPFYPSGVSRTTEGRTVSPFDLIENIEYDLNSTPLLYSTPLQDINILIELYAKVSERLIKYFPYILLDEPN